MSDRVTSKHFASDWETRPLGDMVSRVTERNNGRNGNVLTISAHDGLIAQEEFFNKRVASADLSPYFLLERGDFAYNKSYSTGYPVGVIRRLDRYPKGVVSPLYICFRPNTQLVDSDYLVHYFRSGLMDGDIAWIAKEGARNHGLLNVGVNELFSIRLRVPSLVEQRHIAKILNTADEMIRSTERLIAKFGQVRQGLLRDLLACGIDGSGKIRNPHRSPGSFAESPLGLIPREWGFAPMRDLAFKITDGDHHTPRKSARGIHLLGAGNVQDGFLDLSHSEYVDESEYARMIQRCHPEVDDILISCSGSIGRVARVPPGLRLALVRSVALVKVDTSICTAAFLEIALRSPVVQRQIWNAQKQMAQANLFQGAISELIVPLPEPSEQKEIAERILSYEMTGSTYGRELGKLQIMKQGLMDDLLTGQVRVGASG